MGLNKANFIVIDSQCVTADKYVQVMDGYIGVIYDREPGKKRKQATLAIAVNEPEIAEAISQDFANIAKLLRKENKCTGKKSTTTSAKKKKSQAGPKSAKKSTIMQPTGRRKQVSKASKSAQSRG